MNMKSIIIIVDDEEKILKLYRDTLQDEGFEVFTATNSKEGLELIQEKHPALVLLDFKMPDIDGIEILTKLKENPQTKDSKVVFISAFGNPRLVEIDVNMAKQLGAIDFIQKGLSLDELVKRVKKYLE